MVGIANEVCMTTSQFDKPWTLDSYLKVGGYEALKKILNEKIVLILVAGYLFTQRKTSAFAGNTNLKMI